MRFIPKPRTLLRLVNRKWKIITWLVLIAILYPPISYVVPDTYLMEVISTEVKRVDSTVTGKTRDEYRVRFKFVDEDTNQTKGVFVSRNEDNYWLLKYKSANVQAEFDAYAKCPGNRIYVRFIGWRWEFFSIMTNVVSIVDEVSPGQCVPVQAPVS